MNKPAEVDLPPHCYESERAAIGCALMDASVAPDLRHEWFFDGRHGTVANAILSLAGESSPIDVTTVAQRLPAEFTGLMLECMNACHSPANFPYWRDILNEKLTLRRIAATAHASISSSREPNADADAVLNEFERATLAIRQGNAATAEPDTRSILQELTSEYEDAVYNKRSRGLATGFADIDATLCGLKPGQLFILAARPAVGKTSLAMNIAENMAIGQRIPVGMFSLEMNTKELLHRLTCSIARVDSAALTSGKPFHGDIARLTAAQAAIVNAPLHICDRGGLTIAQLTSQARRMGQRHKIQLLIVDYLGLLRSGEKGRSRYEDTSTISNALKTLAKELGLPVLALAQLNRDNDREGRPPRLSDLRDSGSIEQDADIVGLLFRKEDQSGDAQEVSLNIAKNRSGPCRSVPLIFRPKFTRFEQSAYDNQTPDADR